MEQAKDPGAAKEKRTLISDVLAWLGLKVTGFGLGAQIGQVAARAAVDCCCGTGSVRAVGLDRP